MPVESSDVSQLLGAAPKLKMTKLYFLRHILIILSEATMETIARVKGHYCYLLLLLSVMLLQCNNEVTQPSDNGVNGWTYGSASSYDIASAHSFQISDSISGGTFIFPEGGSGALVIKRVNTAPGVTGYAGAFEISAPVGTHILFRLQHAPDDVDYLLNYCKDSTAQLNSDSSQMHWFSVNPTQTSSTSYVYDISAATTMSVNATKANRIQGSVSYGSFAQIKFPAGSTSIKKRLDFETAITAALENLIASSPDPAAARVKVNSMPWHLTLYNEKYSGNSHNPWSLTSAYRPWTAYLHMLNCEIILTDQSSIGNVAHETGHYFHHVLIGDANYRSIMAKAQRVHEPGMPRKRDDISEDAAYISELLNCGTVKGNSATTLVKRYKNYTNTPLRTDFPSLEGFTTAMCGTLQKQATRISSFST